MNAEFVCEPGTNIYPIERKDGGGWLLTFDEPEAAVKLRVHEEGRFEIRVNAAALEAKPTYLTLGDKTWCLCNGALIERRTHQIGRKFPKNGGEVRMRLKGGNQLRVFSVTAERIEEVQSYRSESYRSESDWIE